MKLSAKLATILIIIILQVPSVYSDDLRVGVTFSPKQSEYLSQDWKKVYLSVLDLNFKIIRLGAYWSEIEKEKDVYSFDVLDWQIKKAKEKNIPVILTVGMKAPRWPEYYIPEWVLEDSDLKFGEDVSKSSFLRERTLKFIEKVVTRYRGNSIIQSWQVENEPLDRAGWHYWWIGREFLKEEVALVKSLDVKNRPIMINVATYPNKALRFTARISSRTKPITYAMELCDILGLNIYPTVGHKLWGIKLIFRTNAKERLEYFSKIVKEAKSKNKDIWITELQAEPWEPGELVHLEKDMPKTAHPDITGNVFNEIRSLGINTILLWGVEYWYFRKTHHKDESWLKRLVLLY